MSLLLLLFKKNVMIDILMQKLLVFSQILKPHKFESCTNAPVVHPQELP